MKVVRRVLPLPNGVTLVTTSMPRMASVSVGVWVGVGGRHEPQELSGVSHFIEHLLFKGTRRRSPKQISQDVEGIGGYLNAFTSEESTCYYSKARHDRAGELIDVLMDMLLNSLFKPVEVNKEREVIKEELAMTQDQPQQLVQEILNEMLWPDHPLGRSLTGTTESLDRLTRRRIVGYQRLRYVGGALWISVAGNLDHDAMARQIAPYARRIQKGTRPTFLPVKVETAGPAVRVLTKETEQTQLALGLRVCSRHDPRRYALRLLNTLLGENMSSRLFQVLREDRGLVYSISSSIGFFEDTGALVVSAGIEARKAPDALRLIVREFKRFTAAPTPAPELRRARDYVIGQMDLSLEGTESQMMWAGEQMLCYGRVIDPDVIRKKLAEVTAAEIRAVAREIFHPAHLSLSLVGPLKNSPALRRSLEW